MNFFGHATVAALRSDHPRFVLGAMLPDLCSMAGLRLGAVRDAELASGVALHHETDRLFHAARPFLSLCGAALQELEAAGVARAAARAVGHVGSELLLDGLLSRDDGARLSYRRALEVGLDRDVFGAVAFAGEGTGPTLERLVERLTHAPIPEGYRDPAFVCDRLESILASRPRLALQPADREPVHGWLQRAASRLERDLSGLLAAVR